MDAKKYVNAIGRKIKCGGKKRKEIKKQLLTDIATRTEQGELLEEVIARMGSVKDIADSFNETLSVQEKRKYTCVKVLKIVIPIVVIVVLLTGLLYWALPKGSSIAESKYFTEDGMADAMAETIDQLEAGDYAAMRENAIPEMESVLTAEVMEDAKAQISDDWGERKSFASIYVGEITQGNTHYAVGEITAIYENTSVTYRITYDKDMRLAGLYMR